MDRIYNKNNGFNHLNQSEAVNLSRVPSQPTRYNSGAFQGVSVERSIKNKILNNLSNQALKILQDSLKSVYFTRSKQIYCPNEAIRFVYFPETAVFSEYKILEDGRTIEIVMTGREGVTGVSSLFHTHRAENFTQILQAGHALEMDSEFLSGKLNDCPEIKESIFRIFQRVYKTNFTKSYLQRISFDRKSFVQLAFNAPRPHRQQQIEFNARANRARARRASSEHHANYKKIAR